MDFALFFPQYLIWHYGRSIRSYFAIWSNFIWFIYHFFSIPLLLATLFSPFERLSEEYKKGLDIGALASTLLLNTIMRCVGAIVRLFIVAIGLGVLAFMLVAGFLLFIVWLMLPIVIFGFLVMGIHGLITWNS